MYNTEYDLIFWCHDIGGERGRDRESMSAKFLQYLFDLIFFFSSHLLLLVLLLLFFRSIWLPLYTHIHTYIYTMYERTINDNGDNKEK